MSPAMFDDYTVTSAKGVGEAAQAVAEAAQAAGFDVLAIHDLAQKFAQKGSPSRAATVVEVCFAQFGSHMLAREAQSCLMMPCRIGVYAKEGETYISALRTRLVGDFYPDLTPMAEQGDALMRAIVDRAR